MGNGVLSMVKRLNEPFKENGFDYKIIKKSSKVVIVSQSKKGFIFGYEVCLLFKAGGQKQYLKNSNEDFGISAWSYNELTNAEIKFNELNEGL
jgi:hypothetical protein